MSRINHAEPDIGPAAVWLFLCQRARKKGFAFWYIGLTALCAIGMGYLGTYPFTAAALLIVMNCGWGSTAMTFWEEIRRLRFQTDILLLPISNHEWVQILQRFFLLGLAVTLGQFLVYALSLMLFDWPTLANFLGLSSGTIISRRRILFYSLIVLIIIGWFWCGYWATIWRGWPLFVVVLLPIFIFTMGSLSANQHLDFRIALGTTAAVLWTIGTLFRQKFIRAWRRRAAEILLK